MSYFKKVYKFFPTFLPTLFNSIVSGIKYDLTIIRLLVVL